MLVDTSMPNEENELLLQESKFKSCIRQKKYCVRIYYIYSYLINKLTTFCKLYLEKICECFKVKKEEHVCFFSQVQTEIIPYVEYPNNIIYWGKDTDEDVFFSEQEQMVIDYMKLKIKKSN